MTRGEVNRGIPTPNGLRGGRIRCFGCGKRIPASAGTCPKCAAVQVSLCECGGTNSAYASECGACGAELSPKVYSASRRPLKFAVAILVLAAVGFGAYQLLPRDPYKERLRAFSDAASEFERGKYDVARVKFARYLADYPEYSRARYMLGLSLYWSGREDEGFAQVRAALERNPDLDEAAEFLALASYRSGRYDQALQICRQAFDAHRTPRMFHLVAGKVLSQPTHLDVSRAAWHLREALSAGIEDPEALLLLAEHTLVLERAYPDELRRKESTTLLEKAREQVAELIRNEPERADLRFFAARCALALGDNSDAWAQLQVCLRLGGDEPAHRLFRARLEWIRGNEAGAKRILDELLITEPAPTTFLSVARIYDEQGAAALAADTIDRGRRQYPDEPALLLADARAKPAQAVELLHRAAEIRPGVAQITVALADALPGEEEAEAILRNHIEEHGHHPLVDLRLAEVLLSVRSGDRAEVKGRLHEAEALVNRVGEAIVPGDPLGIYLLLVRAEVSLHRRRIAEAAALLAEITSRRPDEPLAHLLLADIHRGRDENELAVLELSTVIRLSGESPTLLRARASALLSLGPDSLSAARKDAIRAWEIEPDQEEGLLLLARIEAAVGRTRVDEARGWLRRAAARPHASARPLIELGRLEARCGNLDLGEEHLRAARERAKSPEERLEAVAALAEVESVRAGEFLPPGARLIFERAIGGEPEDQSARLRYAALLLDAGDREGARKWAAAVSEEDPGDRTALAVLFECALADEDQGMAHQVLEKLSVADPGGPAESYARGRLSLEEADPAAAVAHFERALDGAPRNTRAAYYLGVAHLAAGAPEAAQKALERALALTPELLSARRLLADVVCARARVLLDADDPERAIPLLQRGLEAAPDHLGLLALLVEAQFAAAETGDLGLLDMDEEDCLRLIALLEKSAGAIEETARAAALQWAYERLESVYLANKDWAALLAAIDSRLRMDPEDADTELRKGLVLLLAGEVEGAAERFESVARRRGEDWVARAMLAETYVRAGRPDRAAETVRVWLDSHPEDYTARGLLGRIRVLTGDRDAALADLTAALAGDPNQVDAAEALLDLQIARGRTREAVETLSGLLPRTSARGEMLFLLGRARLGVDYGSEQGLDHLKEARSAGFRVPRLRVFSALLELRVLLDRDRIDEAVLVGQDFSEWGRTLEQAIPDPSFKAMVAETWCLAGVAFRRSGANELAEHRYRKALEAFPDFAMAENNLAEVIAATAATRPKEDLEEAVALARSACAASPRESAYLDTLAFALLKSGAAEAASKAYEGVIALLTEALAADGAPVESLSRDFARAEAGAAIARYATGDRDGAAELFRRAVARYPGIETEPAYREIAEELK